MKATTRAKAIVAKGSGMRDTARIIVRQEHGNERQALSASGDEDLLKSALLAFENQAEPVIKHDGTRVTLAGMPASVHLRHHRKRMQNAPETIVWNCSCGFMTWRPRTPKSSIVQLQKAWDRHLTRRTPGNRRQLAVRRLS